MPISLPAVLSSVGVCWVHKRRKKKRGMTGTLNPSSSLLSLLALATYKRMTVESYTVQYFFFKKRERIPSSPSRSIVEILFAKKKAT